MTPHEKLASQLEAVGEAARAVVELRRAICRRFISGSDYRFVELPDPKRASDTEYREAVADWHVARAMLWAKAIDAELGPDGVGAFLAWGDPSLTVSRSKQRKVILAAMEYLQRIARMAVDHEERALRWLTPANFPSQQPYVSYAKLTIKTELQAITIGDGSIKPSIRKSKQVSAFVANTTHGIDGAHMSMTGLRFSRPDRPFAQVCDCFWTRPSDIDALDVETREAMIELHSRDIIGEMRDYLESDRPGLKLPDPPERGTYDINEFRHSQYGFH